MSGFFSRGIGGAKKIQGDLLHTGTLNLKSTNHLFRLTSGSGGVVSTADGAIPSATRKKLKITIDGSVFYFLAATDWVDANSSSASPSPSPSSSVSPSSSPSASPSPSHV